MKILIADDSSLLRDKLTEVLSHVKGVTKICSAPTTLKAIMLFRDFYPDVIVLDIAFKQASGLEVLDVVKKEKPATTVIMFTNYPTEQFRNFCLDLGADYFFDKAMEFHEIPRVISEIISKVNSSTNSN